MAFRGITFSGQNVTPKNDGALYMAHFGEGIIEGCSMAISGDDLVVQSGHIIACGRVCQVDGATPVDLSGRTLQTGYIQVVLNYDISQGEGQQWYTTFVESATTTFPALTQEDINTPSGTIYQLELAVVQVSGGNLTGIYSQVFLSPIVQYNPDGTVRGRIYADNNGCSFTAYDPNDDSLYGGVFAGKTGEGMLLGTNGVELRPNGWSTAGRVTIDPTGQQNGGHFQIYQYGTKQVSANTDTQLFTFTISKAGLYVLSCYMDSNTANNGTYNNQLLIPSSSLNRTIRSTMANGGGSCYAGIYNVSANATVEVRGFAPAACTLRATVTATKLA